MRRRAPHVRLPPVIRTICLILALFACTPFSSAEACQGPLHLVVGRAAGGGADAVARKLAQRYTARSGRTAVVDNKAGAGGNIAAAYVAKAPADGCTLLVTGNYHAINPIIYTRVGYELKEFASVIRAVEGTSVLVVHAEQPFKTLATLVGYAKANPGKLSYGSSGIGSPNHVAMEQFLKTAGIDIVHVPYKGAAPALTDTVGGLVPLSAGSAVAVQPHIASGRLRALAVSTPARWPSLPDVPTMAEAGFRDATLVVWTGILAPAGTPLAVRERLNQEFRAILEEKGFRHQLVAEGVQPVGGSVRDFDKFLKEDYRVGHKLMQELKLKVE